MMIDYRKKLLQSNFESRMFLMINKAFFELILIKKKFCEFNFLHQFVFEHNNFNYWFFRTEKLN